MADSYETLFLPLCAPQNGAVLFLNAAPCAGLAFLNKKTAVLQQHMQPQADTLKGEGWNVVPEFDDESFDLVLLHAPKNITEARALLARGARALRPGGRLIAAAANDAGGGRLQALFAEAGFQEIHTQSKHKARVVYTQKQSLNDAVLESWIAGGAKQKILDGRYVSMPGIFGWDQIDDGSQILVRHLPGKLAGRGGDFGCGYGYLADHVLRTHDAVNMIFCIDADYRAVECARENLSAYGTRTQFLWQDVRKATLPDDLDFIVMNPPFHTGKAADTALGAAFIARAASCLRRGGVLWMVSNEHLPYEKILNESFSSCANIGEERGFKVFFAVK